MSTKDTSRNSSHRVFAAVWTVFVLAFVLVGILGTTFDPDFWRLRPEQWAEATTPTDCFFYLFLGHHWLTTTWRSWGLSLIVFSLVSLSERRFFPRENLRRPLFTDITALVTFIGIVPSIINLGSHVLYRLGTAITELHQQGILLPHNGQFVEFRSNFTSVLSTGSPTWWVKLFISALVVLPFGFWYQYQNARKLTKSGEYWTLREPKRLDGPSLPTVGGVLLFTWILYGGFFVGALFLTWVYFWYTFAVATAPTGALMLCPYNPDNCAGLGALWDTTIIMYLLALSYGLFVGFLISARYWRARQELSSAQNTLKLGVYVLLLGVIVGPPLYILHDRLKSYKNDAMNALGRGVHEQVKRVISDPSSAEPSWDRERITFLTELHSSMNAWPTWPRGLANIGGLSFAGLLPLAGPGITHLFKRRRKSNHDNE